MCYDRLTDDDAAEVGPGELLASEWRWALRNGGLAAAMVLVVMVAQGRPAWLVGVSAVGAVALGALLHQGVLLAGAGILRARARWLGDHGAA